MSHDEETPNGNTAAILVRLQHLEKSMTSMDSKLEMIRQWQIQHPLCQAPGTCIDLKSRVDRQDQTLSRVIGQVDAVRKLVWVGVGVFAFGAIFVPIILEVLRHTGPR